MRSRDDGMWTLRRLTSAAFAGSLVGLVGLLGTGCGGGDAGEGVDDPADAASADRSDWPEVIRIGLVPTEGGTDLSEKFVPVEQYLESALGVEVEMTSASSYQAIITEMANGGFHFAYFGPYSYVEAARRAGAEAVLVELNTDNEPGYNSILITQADDNRPDGTSPIGSIEDARGQRFSFTNQKSTSGYLVPSVLFFQARGIEPADYFTDFNPNGTGNHRNSIMAIKNGDLDLASTNNLDLGRVKATGDVSDDEIKIIWTSPMIPGAPFAAARDTVQSLRRAFIDAMMAFDDPAALEVLNAGGYIETNDAAYDPIRELERAQSASEAG